MPFYSKIIPFKSETEAKEALNKLWDETCKDCAHCIALREEEEEKK